VTPQRELETVRSALAPIEAEPDGDMKRVIAQEGLSEALRRVVASDAAIEFVVPGGGFVGEMAGPFRGPEGFVDGWLEWLQAWHEFKIEFEDLIDAGNGKVLVLSRLSGRLNGTDTSLTQGGAAVFTVTQDKISAIENFLDQDQARKAAGVR
jgi:hypothetical protein